MAVIFCEKCNRSVPIPHKCYIEVDCTHLVPKQEIFENSMALYQWTVTEDIQDHSPYVEWGWYGFVPMIIQRF